MQCYHPVSIPPGGPSLHRLAEPQLFFRRSCGAQAYIQASALPHFVSISNYRRPLAIIIVLVHRRIG